MPPDSNYISVALRKEVALRAEHCCEYCACRDDFSPDSFTVDHIYPVSLGGRSVSDNLAWACFGCNGRKHTKTKGNDSETGEAIALFNPRQQAWAEHFYWSDDAITLVGKTACGRATIQELSLNRAGVINLRRLLASVGLHPPSMI